MKNSLFKLTFAGLLGSTMLLAEDQPMQIAAPQGPAAPTNEFGATATWSIPTTAQVREQVLKLADDRKMAAGTKAALEGLWPAEPARVAIIGADGQPLVPAIDPNLLDRVVQSLALIEPASADILKLATMHRSELAVPEFPLLDDEKQPEFLRNNLRLYYGRWLSQERYYEESLVALNGLKPENVVDPIGLLFFQSVNHHTLLFKKEGLETIAKMFERRNDLPKRYELVGRMMQMDLQALKEDSLDHISRRMNDITRRLEFGRTGKKVQGEEKKVIAALDKLIEEMEKEKDGGGGGGGGGGSGGQGQGGGGPPNGIQSSGPAAESQIARGKGEGNIGRKNIGSKSGWGDLPAKDREEALQQIGKEFPSHYRDVIEEYFRRLAETE